MARTALVPVSAVDIGIATPFTAANVAGHSIPGGGDTLLLVNNASGSPINVTVQTPATEGTAGLAVAEQIVAVAAGTIATIGRFNPTLYDRPSGGSDPGLVYVDFSAVTSVTVAAITV